MEKGTIPHCLWKCESVQPAWEQWRLPKKLKVELPHGPAISLLGIHLERTKSLTGKDTSTSMFTSKLFTIAKAWKQPGSNNRKLA